MFDVGDLPVLTFGNYVLNTEWLSGLWNYTYVFLRFFQNPKKTWLFTFFELLHTFSRTLTWPQWCSPSRTVYSEFDSSRFCWNHNEWQLMIDFTTEVGVNASTDIQRSLTYLTNLRKIIKIVVIRCQILRLKCTKFDFGWDSAPDPAGGAYSAPLDPLAAMPYF